MEETKGNTIFGCVVAVSIAVSTLTLICSTLIYYNSKNNKIAEMVKAGADPVVSAIALDNIYAAQATVYLMSKK